MKKSKMKDWQQNYMSLRELREAFYDPKDREKAAKKVAHRVSLALVLFCAALFCFMYLLAFLAGNGWV